MDFSLVKDSDILLTKCIVLTYQTVFYSEELSDKDIRLNLFSSTIFSLYVAFFFLSVHFLSLLYFILRVFQCFLLFHLVFFRCLNVYFLHDS